MSSMAAGRGWPGFAFRRGLPLDMRMGGRGPGHLQPTSSTGDEETELARVFREYGEEPRARKLAREVGEAPREPPLPDQ